MFPGQCQLGSPDPDTGLPTGSVYICKSANPGRADESCEVSVPKDSGKSLYLRIDNNLPTADPVDVKLDVEKI